MNHRLLTSDDDHHKIESDHSWRATMEEKGRQLIIELKKHLLDTMATMEECAVGAKGARNKELEEEAGLGLDLPAQNGWLTWSILQSLVEDGLIEVVPPAPGYRGMRWRYAHQT